MKNASFRDAEFLDRDALDAELTRVFEHCHDCRRCLPLCPSFPTLFDSIDRHEQNAARLSEAERRDVIDLCYQCQLCYNHCPYHPPHEWEIDFPKLMTRAKSVQAREEGIPLAERIGMHQDAMGKVSCLSSAMTNAAFKSRAVRSLMEKVTGIDRRQAMPTYESQPYSRKIAGHRSPGQRNGRVVLFTTCYVEYAEHRTADDALAVLEHNGVRVDGGYDRCCGAPFLHGGDLDKARRNAEKVVAGLVDAVRGGMPVVVPSPTCSLLIKRDYPELLDSEDARLVAANTYDVCEFLYKLGREKKLVRDFPVALGRVAYHLPCHLKSQNIGFRSQQLLTLAGADVETLERCSGVDGTWGMKARFYEQSLQIADPLIREVRDAHADHVASDCPLSAARIQQETGLAVVHPISLLRLAYGLPERR